MTLGIAFWVILIVSVVFGVYSNRTSVPAWAGNYLPILVLLILLGWEVFGPALHR